MAPKEKANSLLERFRSEINESDFHIPKFISGVSMESDQYGDVLDSYTTELAIQCALICVDEIVDVINQGRHRQLVTYLEQLKYWKQVKEELNAM